MEPRWSAWLVVFAGIATVAFAVALALLTKSKGVMVDLELAKDWPTVRAILARIPNPVSELDPQLKVDYGFLISYPLLNAALFLFVRALAPEGSWVRHPGVLIAGLSLAVLMLMGDAVENAQLLSLTKLSPAEASPIPAALLAQILALLGFFGRMKWICLGLSSLVLGAAFLAVPADQMFRWAGLLLVVTFLVAGGLSLAGGVAAKPALIKLSVNAFGAPWLLSIALAVWRLRQTG